MQEKESPKNSDWFERLGEKLSKAPRSSDEDIAKSKAAWESLEGTSKESAFMKEDRSIAIKVWSYKDGAIGDGWEELSPEDGEYYQKACVRHHLKNPGDANTITMRWVNDQWVEQDEPGKAKSA